MVDRPRSVRALKLLRAAALGALLALLALLAGCGGDTSSNGPSAAPPDATATAQAAPPFATQVPAPSSPGGAGSMGEETYQGCPPSSPGGAGSMGEETYQGCPPGGDGGDTMLNLHKNRIDVPGAYETRTVADMLSLPVPNGVVLLARESWLSGDAATVARDEGRAVEVEGYILMVRHEGPETPNCHDPSARDYHVWLGASPTDSRASAVIVELAPRVVARNPGWGSETDILRLTGKHVRIGGWTMLDQEHPEQLQQTRGTLWEIHPVTRIDVEQNGQFVDLASGRVALGSGPVNRTTGNDGQGYSNTRRPSSGYHHHPRRRRHRHAGSGA